MLEFEKRKTTRKHVYKRYSPSCADSDRNNKYKLNRGYYTSGHIIWNLCNKPSENFTNFIQTHVWKSAHHMVPRKWDFIAFKMEIIWTKKRMDDTVAVNDVTCSRQNNITCAVIHFYVVIIMNKITIRVKKEVTPYPQSKKVLIVCR